MKRRVSGRDRRVLLGPLGVMALVVGTVAACAHSTSPAPLAVASSRVGELADLPLIARDTVRPLLLSDGTPVWEVRHANGSVTVLGAFLSATADGIPGTETMTDWITSIDRFFGGGIHDEFGKALGYAAPDVGGNPPLPTTARDMTTYSVRLVGSTVEVGAAHVGAVRNFDAHHPIMGAGALPGQDVVSFDPPSGPIVPVRNIDQALAEPAGTMSLVAADIVFINDGPGYLCSQRDRVARIPFAPCPANSIVLPGVSDPDSKDFVWAIPGPLFLRSEGSNFSEVATWNGAGAGVAYRITGPLPSPVP